VGTVHTSFESTTELEATNFLEIFKAGFIVTVLLSYVILRESGGSSGLPDGDVDSGVFVINEMLKPDYGIGIRFSVVADVEFEDDR
jgi:hypothetical protein